MKEFSKSVKYIGVNDRELDLFEGQYIIPNGVSYNSYLILDEKIAVMDTVGAGKTDEWFENLERELGGRTPDYLIISHLEPDHAANIKNFTEKYPAAALVASAKAIQMLPQFFDIDESVEKIAVKEGDTLLTSGLDHIFPRNILAGTVRSVTHQPGETYARVEVAMPDYDDAQFVTVILVDPNPTAELDASDKKDSSLRRRRER